MIQICVHELKVDAVEITGLFSVISLILILTRPILGKLVDDFGRKPILIFSCIFFAISYAIFSISNTAITLYIARIFQGIATASMTISTYTIISDTTKEKNFSEAFGSIHSYKSLGYLYGCIIAFSILSFMRFTQGWKVLFIIFSIASIYAVFEVKTKVPESKKTEISVNNKFNKNISKKIKKLLIIIFITYVSSSMLGSIIMIYMQDKFTNNILLLAYAFLPALLAESFFSKKIGIFSDNYGKKYSMMLGLIICGVVSIFTPSANSLILLSMLWIISTLGSVLYSLSEKNIYTNMTDKSSMGAMYSLYSIVCDFGLMIGPIIGGILYDKVSPKAPFYLNGTLMLISSILILILIKEKIQENSQM
ncbi:MFS transporter [Paraclostridium benzoelyticum]|nr:MFS transporter [Paraclostridium benzoelyticum]